MKHFNLNLCVLLACVTTACLLPSRAFTQGLSGSYTINPTQSTGGTNFQTWSAAIAALDTISGPVVFTVYDTVYTNANLTLDTIVGSSSTNTVTFKSTKGDSSKCLLQYASGSSTNDDWVFRLLGADYVTFKSIGFERTGTADNATVVQITGDADNNRFINCLFKGQKRNSTVTLGFQRGIGSGIWFSGNGDNTLVSGCRFLYGYNGIYYLSAGTGNNFSYNLIDTPGSSGFYVNSQSAFKVIGNTFNMGDFGAGKSHYTCYAIRLDASASFLVANNKAIVTTVNAQVSRAFVFSGDNSPANAPAMVVNNTIYNTGGTGNCNGMAINGCNYLNVYYNNVLVNSSLADGAAFFNYITTPNRKVNLLNNNFINKGAGYAISVGDTNSNGYDTVDYNNIQSSGTYIALWGGLTTKYTTFSAFKTGSGKCTNCLNLDPGFVSNSDLHVSNIAINGKALYNARVLDDMDGETRSTTAPDIGADEFFPVTTDAGVSVIDSPSYFCPGTRNVKVRFQNFGFDTLKSLSIGWSVNGVTQTGINWTGSLASGLSSASLNLGSYTFSSNTPYAFKIWTSNPNGSPDGKKLNDTLKLTRYAAMSGTYTIGDTTAANYKSFNQAITAIADRGICGTTTFEVFDGVYVEQIGITQLPGMGSSSPIIFKSMNNDSTKVIMRLPSAANGGTNNAVIQLRGCSYVTFRGITLERTGTNTFAHVIHIMNSSHHNTFSNCQMLGIQNGTTINTLNIWSDQSIDEYNTFINNYIKGGFYNVLITNPTGLHEKGNAFIGNVFENSFNNPIQISYNDNLTLKGNRFLNSATSVPANSDIFLYRCDSALRIDGNIFRNANTGTSVFMNACNARSASPGIIANNVFTRSNGTGVSLDSSSHHKIVFNSFNFTGSSSTNTGIRTSGANSFISFHNNNIAMQAGKVFHVTFGSEMSASSNNNLYARGTDFAYWGNAYSNITDLALASGKEANSITVNPFFTSSVDLHIKNPLMKGAGIPVTGVMSDIDGELRDTVTPDIGADEFKLVPDDAGIIELVNPVAGSCAGNLPLEVVIRNFGNDTLKSATINWSAQGIAKTPFNWTGKLPTNGRDTFVIGTHNFVGSLNPKFIFISTLPNGQTDGIEFNDSLITNRSLRALPAANLGPDRTICLGDTANIGQSSGTGFSYKWLTLSGITLGTSSRLIVSPGVQTKYILEVTNITFGCSKRDTIDVNVNQLPVANAGQPVNICPGSTVQIGAASQAGLTYSWTSSPAGFTSTVSNPSVGPTVTSSYFLRVTSSSTGCRNHDTVRVTVSPVPTINISGGIKACIGEFQSFNTPGASGNTYSWTVTGGSLVSGQNSNSINVRWNTSGAGTLQLIETNNATCKDTASKIVNVSALPVAKFGIRSVCLGDSSRFIDSSVDAQTYAWTLGDGTGSSVLKQPAYVYASAGTYNPQLIVKNADGCADTVTGVASVNPLPAADFTYSRGANRTYDFNDISTVSNGTITEWMWDFGDGDSSDIKQPSHHYQVGNFVVKLCVKSNSGCEHCITQNLNVTGIHETGSDKTLYVIPNPGSGIFTVVSEKNLEGVVVTNAMGQVIIAVNPDESGKIRFDLSGYADGVYFVRTETSGSVRQIKLVKQ